MIYASTSCLKNPKNVLYVLQEYEKAGIENVELGSVHTNFDVKQLMKFNFNFLIHNYFPPPKTPFIFNLSSQNKSIKKRSIELAKTAIDLCCNLESPLYTFHAGFRIDPNKLGKRFSRNKIIERELALKTFVDAVIEIEVYAEKRGIKIAIEPNVVEKFNLTNGKNEMLLCADYFDLHLFFKMSKNKNIGILLDLGHTAVTSYWLKYDRDGFVDLCSKRVLAIHISNNNGKQDQHKSLTKKCWHLSKVNLFNKKPIILETMNLTTEQIKKNIQLVKDSI